MNFTRSLLSTKFDYNKDFFKQFQYLSKNETHHAFLESGRGGRYSIAGIKPVAIITGKDSSLSVVMNDTEQTFQGNLIESFRQWFQGFQTEHDPSLPDFQGGAIGFFSYDCVRYFEKIPNIAKDDLHFPDLYFLLFDDIAIFDHESSTITLITHYYNNEDEDTAAKRLECMKDAWLTHFTDELIYEVSTVDKKAPLSFNEQTFKEAVEKVQAYIAQGDVFQVNLSTRQHVKLECHPMHIYETLRKVNPSPYMAYLHFPEFQIVSGSPELLVKKQGMTVSTRPIAGTRSRGKDEEEDLALANELIENEKERAEHVMLVDLERNDLGRVCKYGTVHVDEFMVIEKYSHVMHIVSNVKGELQENYDYADLIRATFPGGTITGAPKIRTMEIIEELEPTRRGIYTGSIGWIGYDGNMELNIVIRTLLAHSGVGYIQSGAGIVIDSNPKHEYAESLKKAKALLRAVELSKEEKTLV
ncbi:aminodeoxychorismate synthase, component I [Metabacillus fastidiosus]|uniref:aminodeoxychorismate synthase, component I n=1 Tax=Metabacillus fastidiosus TaxID=1458 RepID=UPI002DBD9541|nr:aminodeoxychorismate synthase, component I [Metabacillus fastidiosus]MEC2076617.1 aminodeoxychorismate synthase, component I [Metabacillus fastidiosus]